MTIAIVIGVLVLVFAGLFGAGLLPFGRKDAHLSIELRSLLLDRAAGKIDAEEFERRQAALHAAVLEQNPASRRKLYWLAVPVAILFAVSGYYLSAGKQESLDMKSVGPMGTRFGSNEPPQAASAPASQQNSGGDLNAMAKRLAEKLAKNPENGEGWMLLARTYGELRQPKEAATAYGKAAALVPLDATMLADWADAQVVANGRKWDEVARKAVQRALEQDPKHLKALALAGSEAFERGDYKTAAKFFERMLKAAPAESMDAKLAEANLHEAQAAASGKKSDAAK